MLQVILILLFIVTFTAIAWRKLDWAITLAILFSPAYLIRFTIGPLPSTVLELMLLSVIAVWSIKTITIRWKTKACPAWLPWRWALLAFVLSGVLAVIISPDVRGGAGLWRAYIFEPVLFFIVLANTIKTREQGKQIVWALGAATVLVGFFAILQYLHVLPIPGQYGLEHPPRATSVFPFPTAVGKFVGPLLAFFLGLFVMRGLGQLKPWWEMMRRNLFVVGVIAFGFIGLLFSVSRGALIGVFTAVIFMSFFSRWKRWLWLGIVAALLFVVLVPSLRHNVGRVISATDVSTDVRLVMWKGAWRIIEAHPVLGTGLASFPKVYAQYKEASHTEFFPNPDHLILTLWIEMGLAGLLSFLWLLGLFARESIRLLRYRKDYAIACLSFIIALIVYGFFDTPYFKNDLAIIFWAVCGLLVVSGRIHLLGEKVTQ